MEKLTMKKLLLPFLFLLYFIPLTYSQTQGIYKEDSPHSSGDQGIFVLFKRCDVAVVSSGTDGDYTAPCIDSNGNLRVIGTFTAAGLATEVTLSTIASKDFATQTTLAALNTYTQTGCSSHGWISNTTPADQMKSVKAAAGILCDLTVINPAATKQYIYFFNKASAPDPSSCSGNSDCPIVGFVIPANADGLGAGFHASFGTFGRAFSTGIAYFVTATPCTVLATCTGEDAATAGITVSIGYK